MSTSLNRHLINQTRHDSAHLTQAAFVVHQYNMPGRYKVDIYRHNELRTTCFIEVDSNFPDKQVSLELAALDYAKPTTLRGDCCCDDDNVFKLDKEGYALFYVGKGSGGYQVKTSHLNAQDREYNFDSGELGKGDIFGVTLLRPGHYDVKQSEKKVLFSIEVAAVKPGGKKYLPPEALQVDLKSAKTLKNLKMKQAQGVVFLAHSKNRIIVELTGHSDCDEDKENKITSKAARWTKTSVRKPSSEKK